MGDPVTEFSSHVTSKGSALVRGGKVSPDPDFPEVFSVHGSTGTYMVHIIRTGADSDEGDPYYLTCTCRHGEVSLGQARCSHVYAAWTIYQDRERRVPEETLKQEQTRTNN